MLGTSVSEFRWTKDFQILGSTVVCEDMVLNPEQELLYIGCQGKSGPELTAGPIWVWTVRLYNPAEKVEDIEHIIITPEQQGDWRIRNRLQLAIFDTPQKTNKKNAEERFLFLWDQGISTHREQGYGNHFIYLRGVDSGKLDFGRTVEIQGKPIAIYDLLNYKGSILVSARIASAPELLTIVQCKFTTGVDTMDCDGAVHTTLVKEGFTGFFNTGQLFTIDTQSKTTRIYDVVLPITDADWIKIPLITDTNVPIFEDQSVWVRRYEGNANHGIIHWSALDGYDHGVVVISRRRNVETTFKEEGKSGAILGNVYISAEGNEIEMRRLGLPFYYVEADRELAPDAVTQVEITITDSDTKEQKAVGTFEIDVMKDAWGTPEFGGSLPYLDVYEGSVLQVPFTTLDIQKGNGINFELFFNEKAQGIVEPRVLNEYNVQLIYDPPMRRTHVWREFEVVPGHILALDNGNRLYYFNCRNPNPTQLFCTKKFDIAGIKEKEYLQKGIYEHHGVVFGWTKSENDAYAYFFMENEGYQRFRIEGEVVDAIMSHNKNGELLVLFVFKDRVDVYKLNPKFHDSLDLDRSITKENVAVEFWCPSSIRVDAFEPYDFHILSYCPQQKDQRIVKISLGSYLSSTGSVPIDSNIAAPGFCAMGGEYIIWDNGDKRKIFSVNEEADLARYTIPLEGAGTFQFKEVRNIFCHGGIGQFTVVSSAESGNELTISVFWGNRQRNARLRMQHYVPNQIASDARSFAGYHGITHVLYDKNGQISLLETSSVGPILTADIQFSEHEQEDYEVQMTLRGNILLTKKDVTCPVTIRKAQSRISVDVKSRPSKNTGNINLEEYLKITGPVYHANLIGSQKIKFLKRVEKSGVVKPEEEETEFKLRFDQLRTKGDYAIGVRTTEFSETALVFITEQTKLNSFTTGLPVVSFDFEIQGDGQFLVIASVEDHTGAGYALGGLLWDSKTKTKVFETEFTFNAYCDKLRIAPKKTGDFLVFCHEFHSEKIDILSAKIKSKSIEFELVESVVGMWWWDLAVQQDQIYIYYTKLESNFIYASSVSTDGNHEVTHYDPYELKEKPYFLGGVAAAAQDENTNMLAVSTQGTRILDCVAPLEAGQKALKLECLELDKFRDYEGFELFLSEKYIVQYASTLRSPYDTSVLVWKRQDEEAKGQLYYAIDLSREESFSVAKIEDFVKRKNVVKEELKKVRQLKQKNAVGKINVPFSLTTNSDGEDMLTVATTDPNEPARTYTIQHFALEIPENSEEDFSKVLLEFEGQSTQALTLKEVFNNNGVTKPFKWWPFALIILVLLLLAVAWFVYGKVKATNNDEIGEIYKSEAEDYYKTLGDISDAKQTELEGKEIKEEELN